MSVTPRRPLAVQPHPYIGDVVGRPLDRGMIYFGEPDKDPQDYPITVYLDPEQTKPAHQPIRTKGGFINVFGDITEIFADEILYSLKVLDCYGRLVFYKKRMHRDNITEELGGEIVRAQKAESALQSSIDAEAVRAKAAESDLNADIIKEVSDRESEVARLDEADAVLQAQINSVGGGKFAYKTYDEMVADKSNITAKSSIDVLADTDDKNGTYLYDGANFVKSNYDLEKLIRAKVQNTFGTHAQMVASNLSDGSYALVADDADDKNGIYTKENSVWVKSKYDPKLQAVSEAYKKLYNIADKYDKYLATKGNIYNPNNVESGFVIGTDGVLSSSSSYSVSKDFVSVTPSTEYSASYSGLGSATVHSIAYYTYDNKFISRDLLSYSGTPNVAKFTTPDNAFFIKFNLATARLGAMPIVAKGDITNYMPYSAVAVLENATLSKNSFESIDNSKLLTEHINIGKNLINPNGISLGKVIASDGVETANSAISTTDFMPVIPNITYSVSLNPVNTATYVSLYTYDKGFISRITVPPSTDLYNLVISSGAYFVKLSYPSNLLTINDIMFYKGMKAVTYNSYNNRPTLTGVDFGEDIAKVVDPNGFLSNFKKGYNLLDLNKVLADTSVSSAGVVTPTNGLNLSDFIAVKGGDIYSTYSAKGAFQIAYYDSNKSFLSRSNSIVEGYQTVTVPTSAAFVRLNIYGGINANKMFYKGSNQLAYKPYTDDIFLDNVQLSDNAVAKIGESLNIKSNRLGDTFYFDTKPSNDFSLTTSYTGFEDWQFRPSADVMALYNQLQREHPEYITKHPLGEDDFGNELAYFVFEPKQPRAQNKRVLPTIFFTLSIHGSEKTPTMAAYLTMKEVCENWRSSKDLEAIRFNSKIILMPVAVPSAWNATNGNGYRSNGNGVDINRNFYGGWKLGGQEGWTYSGDAPADQKETQAIMQIFEDNPDINAFYDYHNFTGSSDVDYYIWVDVNADESQKTVESISNKLIGRLTRKWQAEFDWLPQSPEYFAGYSSESAKAGKAKDYARELGIEITATFEVCKTWWLQPDAVPYDNTHAKSMVETTTHLIVITLEELERRSQLDGIEHKK